jgi:hypothetical protein
MSSTRDYPHSPWTGDLAAPPPVVRRPPVARTLVVVGAVLAASVLVGLAGGVAWALLAPRVTWVVVSPRTAQLSNAETSAFIAADAWYCLVGVIGGAAMGLGGYLLAVRRHGPAAMAALAAGSVAAGLAARWLGQMWGRSQFYGSLFSSHQGALLHRPLLLGGGSAVLWPAVVSWPLAACAVAGALALFSTPDERSG